MGPKEREVQVLESMKFFFSWLSRLGLLQGAFGSFFLSSKFDNWGAPSPPRLLFFCYYKGQFGSHPSKLWMVFCCLKGNEPSQEPPSGIIQIPLPLWSLEKKIWELMSFFYFIEFVCNFFTIFELMLLL